MCNHLLKDYTLYNFEGGYFQEPSLKHELHIFKSKKDIDQVSYLTKSPTQLMVSSET